MFVMKFRGFSVRLYYKYPVYKKLVNSPVNLIVKRVDNSKSKKSKHKRMLKIVHKNRRI